MTVPVVPVVPEPDALALPNPRRDPRVALDGLGTDARPEPEIDAALRTAGAGVDIALVGDQARLAPILARRRAELGLPTAEIPLIHAAQEIAMDESPAKAVRAKPESSLCVAMNLVRSGACSGVVSAGNSGAVLAAALFRLGRIPGIERPAIVANLPKFDGELGSRADTVLLDAGANVECTPLNLVQFAVLGATWSRVEHGIARPRVAILSNGHEATKGTALTRAAHQLLRDHVDGHVQAHGRASAFEFVGYVEPHGLFVDDCDVIVTDGWTGNVALKLTEAAVGAWPRMLAHTIASLHSPSESPNEGAAAITAAIAPALQALRRRFDPDTHGGAPLLGVDGAVIICHGAAGSGALQSALLMAHRFHERGVIEALVQAVADHRELFELARTRVGNHGNQ